MKKLLLVPIALLMLGGTALADVDGTKHDLNNVATWETGANDESCVFCHTPHQASTAASQDPLWNHTLSSAGPYAVYGSSTIDATDLSAIPAAVAGTATATHLCLSCHDGTVAPGSVYNPPNVGWTATAAVITGNANVGTNLADDHPVNFTYDAALATADGGLATPLSASEVVAGIPLFTGKMQCASCHNPHDSTNAPFLRATNANSALCTTCHTNK